MNAENLNRWLTLGANLGVLIGIILLIVELNQNSTLMRAQLFKGSSILLDGSLVTGLTRIGR